MTNTLDPDEVHLLMAQLPLPAGVEGVLPLLAAIAAEWRDQLTLIDKLVALITTTTTVPVEEEALRKALISPEEVREIERLEQIIGKKVQSRETEMIERLLKMKKWHGINNIPLRHVKVETLTSLADILEPLVRDMDLTIRPVAQLLRTFLTRLLAPASRDPDDLQIAWTAPLRHRYRRMLATLQAPPPPTQHRQEIAGSFFLYKLRQSLFGFDSPPLAAYLKRREPLYSQEPQCLGVTLSLGVFGEISAGDF